MISLHWHLTPRLNFLYVLHELLLLCGKYYILYNIRRSAFGAASPPPLFMIIDDVKYINNLCSVEERIRA